MQILKWILVFVCFFAIGFGIAESVKAGEPFSDPAANFLAENDVSFVHIESTDTFIILRSGTPPAYVPELDTPRKVCEALKTRRVVSRVLFWDISQPEAYCR